MGTWCPNCLDGSKYYTEFYEANKDKDFEIVALAVEFAKTQEGFWNIKRLKEQIRYRLSDSFGAIWYSSKAKATRKITNA